MRTDLYPIALTAYLNSLRANIFVVQREISPPTFVDGRGWRHQYCDDILCAFLKLGKLTSSLGALMVLINAKYTNEAGAIVRICDDMANECFFVLRASGKRYYKFLRAFYIEEFVNPERPLVHSLPREGVTARKIRGEFSNSNEHGSNQSDVQLILTAIHGAYSGYIHGAYPHIMEMYGGDPPSLHLGGVPDTDLCNALKREIINYTWRAFCILEMLCDRIGMKEDYNRVRSIQIAFWREFEFEDPKRPLSELR